MNKKEAVSVLQGAWFVCLDGNHTHVEAQKALELAVKCFDEAKPYKDKAKALRAENKAIAKENEALRAELLRQTTVLRTLFGNIAREDSATQPDMTEITIRVDTDTYKSVIEPFESDPRYRGEGENV